jgi:hypothetical protein
MVNMTAITLDQAMNAQYRDHIPVLLQEPTSTANRGKFSGFHSLA